jgi:protein TonB
MDLRLTGCCAGALLLHVALLALGSLQGSSPVSRARSALDETSVELLEPPEPPRPAEPEPPPTPPASSEPLLPAPDALPRLAARAIAPRRPVRAATAPSAPSALDAAPAEGDGVAPADGAPAGGDAPPAPRQRLSPEQLGLGLGRSAALLERMQDVLPTKVPDVGGRLRQELMARDTQLGLGPGGAVANAVRGTARELAPMNSEATISVDLTSDGSVASISLDSAASDDRAWAALVTSLREKLKSLSVRAGRPLRVTLLVSNRATLRAGNSSSPLDFDLSNIGSPTIQSLHVRVVAQSPL